MPLSSSGESAIPHTYGYSITQNLLVPLHSYLTQGRVKRLSTIGFDVMRQQAYYYY
jgi:hypothetical protein